MPTIFPHLTLDRQRIHWENWLDNLTPVEQRGGLWFKREDYFAPLGAGFINGGKVRQGVFIFNRYVRGQKTGIVAAMSVHSPQHSMQAVVARHFGIPSIQIIGATKPTTALKHENIRIAAWFGAKFKIENVAYNPALQRAVRLVAAARSTVYPMGYAISIDHKTHPRSEIEAFHSLGAAQVQNIPEHIDTLIIPTGSGISTTSILYGLRKHHKDHVKRVILIGVGPSKLAYVHERLAVMGATAPVNTEYRDLHGQGVYSYSDTVKASYEGIEFHPRYEAKAWTWASNHIPGDLFRSKSMFWIIGAEPHMAALPDTVKQELGRCPTALPMWEADHG